MKFRTPVCAIVAMLLWLPINAPAQTESNDPKASPTAPKHSNDSNPSAVVPESSDTDDSKKSKRRSVPRSRSARKTLFEQVGSLQLSAKQSRRLNELKAEYGPKIDEAEAKLKEMTSARAKARLAAFKKAKAAGKRGGQFSKAVSSAISPAQKKKLLELRVELLSLQKAVREKIIQLLTTKQKAQLAASRKPSAASKSSLSKSSAPKKSWRPSRKKQSTPKSKK